MVFLSILLTYLTRGIIIYIAIERDSCHRSRKEAAMSKVSKIKAAIEALDKEEYDQLRSWFSERDWEEWDRQIESDSEAGKLDFLLNEALDEKAQGKLKDL